MSSATPFDPDPLEDLLGLMEAVADRFDKAELWRSPGPKLADAAGRYERVVRRFEFGRLRFVSECFVQDVAGQEAGLSTEAFLQARPRLSPGEAKARVRSARELVGSVSISGEMVEPELAVTAAGRRVGAARDPDPSPQTVRRGRRVRCDFGYALSTRDCWSSGGRESPCTSWRC